MKTPPQRYDLLAMSLLVFSAILSVWLGLWGPVNLNFGPLKDWQTLMAGGLAVLAAGLAYRAAMAKVNFDREQAAREVKRRELSILMKVDFAIGELHDNARRIDGTLMFFQAMQTAQTVTVDELRIFEPADIEEAWQHLDIFPQACIHELRNVRKSIRELDRIFKTLSVSKWTVPADSSDIPLELGVILSWAHEIWQSCAVLQSQLAKTVRELAPQIDADERMSLIYGEPDGDDLDDWR